MEHQLMNLGAYVIVGRNHYTVPVDWVGWKVPLFKMQSLKLNETIIKMVPPYSHVLTYGVFVICIFFSKYIEDINQMVYN